jgi:GntR family transcriptional regulator, rspAB operon transcriptional repressor
MSYREEHALSINFQPEWAIDHATPVGPQVYRILRRQIVSLVLRPGALVSESEVARTFALSRQPVREAFIKLAEEGLVEVRPQRGTLVRKISVQGVMDARFVREAIEADIVKLAADLNDRTIVADLRRQIALQREVQEGDSASFMPLDDRFHRTLANAAGKSHAWRVIEDVKAQMDRVRFIRIAQLPLSRLVAQHERVVDAIEAGNPSAADAAMRDHLREILGLLPILAAAEPELFDAT